MKNKIIVDAPGQTCNRLWSYLDTIAWAVTNKRKVKIWFWDPSIRYFDSLRDGIYSSFPFHSKTIISVFGEDNYLTLLFRILDNKWLHAFYRTKLARRWGFVCGWEHRGDATYHPQIRQEVLAIFKPNREICNEQNRLFERYKRANVVVIGIHIRRGDYKTFADGQFYFSIEEYVAMMHRVQCLLQSVDSNLQCHFFISSNENIDSTKQTGLSCFSSQTGSTAIHDLYGLSLCDYILGPVSTFSMWAAWYGAKPLCQVSRVSNLNFSLLDFKVPKGFFQNW